MGCDVVPNDCVLQGVRVAAVVLPCHRTCCRYHFCCPSTVRAVVVVTAAVPPFAHSGVAMGRDREDRNAVSQVISPKS